MSGHPCNLLTEVQELQMVAYLVQLNWPKEEAEYVVRRVSHGIDVSAVTASASWEGKMNDVLKILKDQQRITALQSFQVRHYLHTLDLKARLCRPLLAFMTVNEYLVDRG